MQLVADQVGTVFESQFAPGDIDENLLHRTGGDREKMPVIAKVLLVAAGEPQSGLVDEAGGLERLTGLFIGHLGDGESTQVSVDQWEPWIGRLRSAQIQGAKHSLRDGQPSEPFPPEAATRQGVRLHERNRGHEGRCKVTVDDDADRIGQRWTQCSNDGVDRIRRQDTLEERGAWD